MSLKSILDEIKTEEAAQPKKEFVYWYLSEDLRKKIEESEIPPEIVSRGLTAIKEWLKVYS